MVQPTQCQAFVFKQHALSRGGGGGRVSDGFQDHHLSCWKGRAGAGPRAEPSEEEVGQLWLSDPPGDHSEEMGAWGSYPGHFNS